MSADAEQLGPAVLFGPERGEPLRAIQHDWRQVAQRFDVIDRGGLVIETGDRGKRRFDTRLRALALERFNQRRLFPRLVRAGSAMNDDVAVEAGTEDVLAD